MNLPGIPLRDEDLKNRKILTTGWQAKAEYKWDTGVAIGTFLAGLKAGKILARECKKCGRIMVPPRMFCELCFKETDRWVEIKDSGKINTFSISYVAWDASRLKDPQIPVVVELDGASPGMGILHLLGEIKGSLEELKKRLKIGSPVKAVWKDPKERIGAITDIKYFKLV